MQGPQYERISRDELENLRQENAQGRIKIAQQAVELRRLRGELQFMRFIAFIATIVAIGEWLAALN